jgi:hypothetical protein
VNIRLPQAAGRALPRLLDRLAVAVADFDAIDESRLRLGVAILLSAGAVLFFREVALQAFAAALAGGLLVLAGLYVGFHRVGLRTVSSVWPGMSRGLGTALLVACLCPPGLPLPLVAVLGALAVAVEGGERRLLVPLALGGVLVAWPLAWAWRAQFGIPLLAPFTLKPLYEPIVLWTRFQINLDPVRLYTGNVAGPLGATSFGLAALGTLVLGYGRRVAWYYLAGFYAPLVLALALSHQPLTIFVLSAHALVLAAIVGADPRKLPLRTEWQLGAGVLAGALSAGLLLQGHGSVSYGVGVVGAAALVSAFQLFGLTGSPAVVPEKATGRGDVVVTDPKGQGLQPGRIALLVLFAPAGLLLLWRDETLPDLQRVTLVGLGGLMYVAAVAGSLTWLWLLRLPA